MSLSADVLSRATPTRLICRGGRWVLELTRLEAVDRDVFQPRLTRLEGADSILAALRRSDDGQHLVTGAAHIMRSPRVDEDRAFEVSEGDWIPSADSALPTRREQQADSDAVDAGLLLAEVRAELAVLRASHARLRDRVIALEAAQSGAALPNARPPRGSRARRRSEPPPALSTSEAAAEPLGNQPAFAATLASSAAGLGSQQPPIAASAQPAPAHQSFEQLAKAFAGEQPPPVLALPTLVSLGECLTLLMGSVPTLEQAAAVPFASLESPHACKLLDDDGRERGAIILDLRAAVLLGAALLALPEEEALRQVRENEPSEDTLLAMSEICNNLTSPLNAVTGNQHVRSTALTGVEVSALPVPRARLDVSACGGRLVLAMF
jgi:hypothetical protein